MKAGWADAGAVAVVAGLVEGFPVSAVLVDADMENIWVRRVARKGRQAVGEV